MRQGFGCRAAPTQRSALRVDRAERALPLEGLSLGEHYRLSDYGVAGLALQSAGTVGEALQLIKTNMLLFRKDIHRIAVRRSSCDTVGMWISTCRTSRTGRSRPGYYRQRPGVSALRGVPRPPLLGDLELVRLRSGKERRRAGHEEYFRCR